MPSPFDINNLTSKVNNAGQAIKANLTSASQAVKANLGTNVKTPFESSLSDINKKIDEGIEQVSSAAQLFQAGDVLGGVAAVMDGVGAFGSVVLLALPFGPILAAVLSAITSIISAVLRAMRPHQESLESKIKRYIEEETLYQSRIALVASQRDWELAKDKINFLAAAREKSAKSAADIRVRLADGKLGADERAQLQRDLADYERMAAGFSWEYLRANIGWEAHKQQISATFAALSQKRSLGSEAWMALWSLAVSYSVDFWAAFESMGGLIGDGSTFRADGQPTVAGAWNRDLFQTMRTTVARQLREDLEGVWFELQNKPVLFHLNKARDPFQPLHRYVGLTGNSVYKPESEPGGESDTFAVSQSGTIFTSGRTGPKGSRSSAFFVGRGDASEWREVKLPWADTDKFVCEQVVVADTAEQGKLIVLLIHKNGKKVSYRRFDDRDGEAGDHPYEWTLRPERWLDKDWTTLDFNTTKLERVLTVGYCYATQAGPSGTKEIVNVLHVLAMRAEGDARMYRHFAAAGTFNWEVGKITDDGVQHFAFTPDQVANELHLVPKTQSTKGFGADVMLDGVPGIADWKHEYEGVVYSRRCCISFEPRGMPNVQLGKYLRGYQGDAHPYFEWNLQEMLDTKSRVHQARRYPDGSVVVATAEALWSLTAVDRPAWGKPPRWLDNRRIETQCFAKQVSPNAHMARALWDELWRLAPALQPLKTLDAGQGAPQGTSGGVVHEAQGG